MKSPSTHSIFKICAMTAVLAFFALPAVAQDFSQVTIGGGPAGPRTVLSFAELEAQGTLTVKSPYFDKAMGYRDSTFRAVSFAKLIERFMPGADADAVLLNCRDDYQGVLSIADVRRYDLRLATAIHIRSAGKQPDWLNPLLVIVPEGVSAPKIERFMTANIREILFVRLADYYAPLSAIADKFPGSKKGARVFQDNCLFCHSLKGVGGNKGTALLAAYDFNGAQDSDRFRKDFTAFHNAGNADKQDVGQFVTRRQLDDVADFLQAVAR